MKSSMMLKVERNNTMRELNLERKDFEKNALEINLKNLFPMTDNNINNNINIIINRELCKAIKSLTQFNASYIYDTLNSKAIISASLDADDIAFVSTRSNDDLVDTIVNSIPIDNRYLIKSVSVDTDLISSKAIIAIVFDIAMIAFIKKNA